MNYQIAIDGPAGAGKSTIAKLVAKELSFVYIDTGAMYRTMALLNIRAKVDLNNEDAVSKLCETADIKITYQDGEQVVILNGENVNGFIRQPEVGDAASSISVYKRVREYLVKLQQELANSENVIMDGRDIGSCVLPNAILKIYLDADVKVRAKRRYDELLQKGMEADLKEIEEQMIERDYRDMHRDNSPLTKVDDAVVIDSSYMDIEQVKDEIVRLFKEKALK